MPYDDDEDDAVRIASDSEYGLGGGGSGRSRPGAAGRQTDAHRPGRDQRPRVRPGGALGGYEQSGVGREGGTFCLEEFDEAIQR